MTADPGRSGGEGTTFGLTHWHIHNGSAYVHTDLLQGEACGPANELWPRTTPVLVLDLAGAREQIARTAKAHQVRYQTFQQTTHIVCSCGDVLVDEVSSMAATYDHHWAHQAEMILAALASQERGE